MHFYKDVKVGTFVWRFLGCVVLTLLYQG